MDKREAHLNNKIDAMKLEAMTQAKKKNQKGALFALKKKRMYDQEVTKISGMKMTLEIQQMSLESAVGNVEVLKVMQKGTLALKKVRGTM